MKLTLTLSPAEQTAIAGWAKFYADHPQYIGVPRPDPAPGPLPGGGFPWQTRIVLDDMSRARYEEIAAQFGVSTDPLAAFRARLKVGQLCAWALCTDAERTALDALYSPGVVVQYVQFYGASGGGGVNVNVRPAGGGWEFWSIQANAWVPDVGGAGDTYVAWICARNDPPRAVPAPFPQ